MCPVPGRDSSRALVRKPESRRVKWPFTRGFCTGLRGDGVGARGQRELHPDPIAVPPNDPGRQGRVFARESGRLPWPADRL